MGFFDVKQTTTAPQMSEVAECDKQLAALAQRRREIICKIGEVYVANNDSQTAAGTLYEAYMKEIEGIAGDVAALEKRKLAVQGLRKCESCGNILVLDSAFCNKCGEKLQPLFAAEPISAVKNNTCTKCGAAYEEGAAFCTNCGNRLK